MVSIDDQYDVLNGLFKKTHSWPLKFNMANIRHLDNHQIIADCQISVKFCMSKQFFLQNSIMGQIPTFHRMYFLFS